MQHASTSLVAISRRWRTPFVLQGAGSTAAVWAALAFTMGPAPLQAQQTAAASEGPLTVRLMMVDSAKGDGATLGLDYKYERSWSASGARDDSGSTQFDFGKAGSWDRLVELRGQGTLTASADRNPNKLLDLAVNARYQRLGDGWLGGLGATLKAEADQSLDDRQFMYGLQANAWLNNPLGQNGWAVVYLNFGRVEPRGDALRQQTLGAAGTEGYRRWDAEMVIHKDLKGELGNLSLQSFELQYRHFQELSAPTAIRQAGLDRHRLGTARLNFGGDKFIAFSKGSLPFDKRSDRAVKLGWTHQF